MVASAPGMCIIDGCGKPQHCTGRLTYRWCKQHLDERREQRRVAHEQQDTAENRRGQAPQPAAECCVVAGCNEPRMVGPKSGKTLTRCETHQRAYDRKAKAEKRLSNGVTQPVTTRAPKAQTQSPVPKRRSKKVAPTKVLLLDYQADTIRLLTIKSEVRVPMAGLRRGEPHPYTVGFYRHIGYQIAESRCPEQVDAAITLQQIIQRARWYAQHTPDLPAHVADTLLLILDGKRAELRKEVPHGLAVPG